MNSANTVAPTQSKERSARNFSIVRPLNLGWHKCFRKQILLFQTGYAEEWRMEGTAWPGEVRGDINLDNSLNKWVHVVISYNASATR
jgi:hypothetical protein